MSQLTLWAYNIPDRIVVFRVLAGDLELPSWQQFWLDQKNI